MAFHRLIKYVKKNSRKSFLVFISLILTFSGVVFAFRPAAAAGDNISYSHQIGVRANEPALHQSTISPDGTLWVVNPSAASEVIHVSAAGERIGAISFADRTPLGVAVDAAGNVYMLNNHNSIAVFDSGGNHVSDISLPYVNTPKDLAMDSGGNFYVSYAGNQVKKFDGAGNELFTIGTTTPSSNDGFFNGQEGIFVDGSDRLYVADNSNNRVQVFDGGGNFLNKWEVNYFPKDVSVDNGLAYVIRGYSRDAQINDALTGASVGVFTTPDPSGNFLSLAGISVGNGGTFFINDSRHLVLLDNTHDLLSSHEIIENPANGLYAARLVARDAAGNVYILDSSDTPLGNDSRQIQKFTPSGQFIESIVISVYKNDAGNGYYGSFGQSFQIDSAGNLYFNGSFNSYSTDDQGTTYKYYNVAKYSPSGGEPNLLVESNYSSEDGTYSYSIGSTCMLVNPTNGQIIVVGNVYEYMGDGSLNQYLGGIFNADGSKIQWLGDRFPDDGSFYGSSTDVTVGLDGSLYFAGYYVFYDSDANMYSNYSVIKTDNFGQNAIGLIMSADSSGDVYTNVGAYSVGVDRNGNIYTGGYIDQYDTVSGVSSDTCTVGQFSPSGEYLRCIVKQGNGTNQEDVQYVGPGSSLVVDQYGNVYVLDSSAGVVKVYLIETFAPSPPSITSAKSNKNSISISWDPPTDDGNTSITNYVIRARLHGSSTWFEVAVTDGSARNYEFSQLGGAALAAGAEYDIQIVARNSAGDSQPTETSVTTGGGPITPGAPNTGL